MSNQHELVDIKILSEATEKNNFAVTYKKEPDIDICDSDLLYTNLLIKHDKEKRSLNASVAIASAITAYAYLSIYDALTDEAVIATDTDSLITSKKLPDHLVGEGLGQMKLEATFTSCLFVKPKVYYYENNGVYTYKFKGIPKGKVTYQDYHELYEGRSVQYVVELLRKMPGGGLKQVETTINVSPPDDSKRLMIKDSKGLWINTKPINLNNIYDSMILPAKRPKVEKNIEIKTKKLNKIQKRFDKINKDKKIIDPVLKKEPKKTVGPIEPVHKKEPKKTIDPEHKIDPVHKMEPKKTIEPVHKKVPKKTIEPVHKKAPKKTIEPELKKAPK